MMRTWTTLLWTWVIAASAVAAPGPQDQAPPPPPTPNAEGGQETPPDEGQAAADESAEAEPAAAPEITGESIQALRAEVEAAEGLGESVRSAALDLLTRAQEHLRRAGELAVREAEFESQTSGAAKRLEELKAELEKPLEAPQPTPPEDATVAQLEQGLAQAKADLEAVRRRVTEIEGEQTLRSERRSAIPGEVAQLRQDVEEVTSRLEGAEEPESLLDRARLLHDRALRKALREEIDVLEDELRSYDARRELLPVRLDRAKRQVKAAEAMVAAWQDLVDKARQREAKRAEREAKRLLETARQHPVLEKFADRNRELAAKGAETAAALARVADERKGVRAEIDRVASSFIETQRDVARLGLKQTIGKRMRDEMQALDLPELRDGLSETEEAWNDAYDARRTFEEDREDLQDVDEAVSALFARARKSEVPLDREAVATVARELVVARRQLLDKLLLDTQKQIEELEQLHEERAELLEWATAYASYIEERMLWVRTFDVGSPVVPEKYREGVLWVFNTTRLRNAIDGILDHPVPAGALLLVLIIWFWLTRRLGRLNRSLSDHTSSYKTDSFGHTILSLVLTLVIATPVPLLLYWMGWLLARPTADETELGRHIGAGLQVAAVYLYPYFFVDRALAPDGLADAHFRWPPEALRLARRQLRWYIPTVAPLLVFIAGAMRTGNEDVIASLGRIAFLLGMVATSVFLQRLLRPRGPLRQYYERHEGTLVPRLRPLWYPLAVGLPLALAALSWYGYHYSATHLHKLFLQTLGLVVLLVVLNALLLRWLFLARRRIAVEEARRRREQALTEAKAAEGGQKVDVPVIDEAKVNLPAMSAQTKQLFRSAVLLTAIVGIWAIWADVVPALRVLDRVQLWPEVRMLEEQPEPVMAELMGADSAAAPATPAPGNGTAAGTNGGAGAGEGAGGAPSGLPPQMAMLETTEQSAAAAPFSITLGNLAFALLLLLITWVAFRNVPGLAEMLILQRLPLDAGARYALSTVLRYFIAIVGVSVAASVIGLSWTKVQWLAAALTFGLAFGLQEIFANFVSGLIILAERPIRVGDTVTVGQTSGTVHRIRMRATTILDWDRKELIIPNKNFITNEVVNWTLSDPVLRVIIPVGVSYGSDVDKVERTLHKIARNHKIVLDDPKPQVWFTGFGDSTLNFELRAFIPHIEHLLATKHELHNMVFKEFRKAGIEIAFPQRDLHLRSSEGLKELVQKREHLPAGEAGEPI